MSGEGGVHRCNGSVIEEDNAVVYGDGNIVNGANATIAGDGNTVTGDDSTVRGNENIVTGDRTVVHGYRNTVTGDARFVIGDSNFVAPEDHPQPAERAVGINTGARGSVAAVRWRPPHSGIPVTNVGIAPDFSALCAPVTNVVSDSSGPTLYVPGPAALTGFGPAALIGFGWARTTRARARSMSVAPPPSGTLRDILQKMLDRDKLADESEERVKCVICCERIKCVAFDPCGHVESCVACTLKLVKPGGQELECPVCKVKVGGAAFARV